VEYRILGPLEVWHEGTPVQIRGSRQRALLALFLLHANEVVSSDRLIDQLWGPEPPEAGGTALRVRVSQLRKALGTGARDLQTRAPGYVLQLTDDQVDLRRFERLVAEADRVDHEVASTKLREALALWRGPPLDEFAYEQFAQPAIARLEELRLVAVEKRVEVDLALGRHVDLVPELEALVEEQPLREAFRRQLMLALYRSGRQGEALELYRRTRQALVEGLGIEPAPALQELEQAILRQDPDLDLEPTSTPQRSILVAPLDPDRFDQLLALAEPLARRPPRELILAQLIRSREELGRASALAREGRESLRVRGISARSAAFTTERPGADLVRIAQEQDVDLLLVEASDALLDDATLEAVLVGAPCDVAALVTRSASLQAGPVLVPFTGADHDWAAIEVAAWLARNQDVPLRLAGPIESARDASRLLASASLAVQRALGVAAEPLLVAPGAEELLVAAEDAALTVVGLSDRWPKEGLGKVRDALVTRGHPPAVLVRRGLRPGGLAPPESVTRFTWSIAAR
jgi:DNA-binding SARP family transcriptional activator